MAWTILMSGWVFAGSASAQKSDIEASRKLFRTGQYVECLESARNAIKEWAYSMEWRTLEIESLMALGRYGEAADRVEAVLKDSRPDIRLLKVAHTVYQHNGRARQSADMLAVMYRMAGYRRMEYLSGPEAVALGESLLLLGADPRTVLENFYNQVMKNDPNCREAYLAAGALATAKQDYALAADQYREALKRFGDDPDAHFGLARTFYYSDRQAMLASLDAALHLNPRHAAALILLAEHQIDCEDYEAAAKSLERVLAVNPWRPEAWAYRAVLDHLDGDPNEAVTHRANGLKFWPANPQVDHLIGRKLSQKYRFTEGASAQRQALKADPNYLPAKIQLAQDLLRLGDESQGWTLADEVNRKDPYNVEAYNLVNLHDTISAFTTLTGDGLQVRMDAREAAIYGDRVIELLQQARSDLCKRYNMSLERPVIVELFPDQQDFAVRTFGMPGGDGFLGVCFGSVITATSPRPSRAANWQATLWHEFAHAVTLSLTANRMPRWLSEGISVYEERQHNVTWGQRMTPEYRRMILDGGLTPLGQLSTAFMSPPTPIHLQFAYFESYLAVEFLVQRYGLASLRAILADLAKGEAINAAIARRAGPLEQIEKDFAAFARKQAEDLAPGLDWALPPWEQHEPAEQGALPSNRGRPARDAQAVARWLDEHPNSLWGLTLHAKNLLAEGHWEQAKAPLKKLISLYPGHVGQDNAYQLLAEAHRNLKEINEETEVLSRWAALSADAGDAYNRLMEIGMEQEDWTRVARSGEKCLAVNPLLATAHWRLGRANEALGRDEQAVDAYRRLLLLDPADPVDVHYRLAKLLRPRDPAVAKRHILEALADAPRFREGHRLLLEITGESR